MVHCSNKKTSSAAARVKHNICSLNIQQVTDMARGKDNAQCLTITSRVAHKFSIEPSDKVLTGTAIFYVVKNILFQKFGIEFQWRFTKLLIDLVQASTRANYRKFTH